MPLIADLPAAPFNSVEIARLENISAISAVPRAKCAVRRPTWCIEKGPYRITHFQRSRFTVWRLSGSYLDQGPITIYESRACDRSGNVHPRRLYERSITLRSGRVGTEIDYSISGGGRCSLKFILPENSLGKKSLYKSTAMTSIRYCLDSSCSGERLAILSNNGA